MSVKRCLFAAALAALAAGCTTFRESPDGRVVISADVHALVWVSDMRFERSPGGHCTVQANAVNGTDDILKLEYRVDWYDGAGMALPSVMSTWQPVSLAPHAKVPLTATAPTPGAVDYRMYIQARRE